MDATRKPFAWQPFTSHGVAAFAASSWGRVLLAQVVAALVSAAAVLWFLHSAWFPVVGAAIQQLPDDGQIRSGQLDWLGSSPATLAENRFLAFTVDLQHTGTARPPAHLLVEFGRGDYKFFSLLGFVQGIYPRDRQIAFNRLELAPWWGAWSPMFLVITAGLVVSGLLFCWAALAALYAAPAWLAAFFANRHLTLGGGWRLSGAALIPGALVMAGSIVLYGLGGLDLIRLGIAFGAHFVLGWVYVIAGLTALPRHPAAEPKTNPFVPKEKERGEEIGNG